MSVRQFCDKRLVVQSAGTSVYDAARALESNHIGAIVVQDAGHIVGIVTDRDLALRVLGFELDPEQTRLSEVMTPEPTTMSIDDSVERAITLMRDRRVRRVPIVDGDRVVGMVTLDDLILSGEIDSASLARVVRAQLEEPSDHKPAGVTHPTRETRVDAAGQPIAPRAGRAFRHWARAEQTLHDFTSRLRRITGLDDPEQALTVFEVVAVGLGRRLSAEEARAFAAQLPWSLRETLLDVPPGPDRQVTWESIANDVAYQLNLDYEQASTLVRKVTGSLAQLVSSGEVEHVKSQLPREMRDLLA